MREHERLLKRTPMKTTEEYRELASFMLDVQSVNTLAAYAVKSNTYRYSSLALNIGKSLPKISQHVEVMQMCRGSTVQLKMLVYCESTGIKVEHFTVVSLYQTSPDSSFISVNYQLKHIHRHGRIWPKSP